MNKKSEMKKDVIPILMLNQKQEVVFLNQDFLHILQDGIEYQNTSLSFLCEHVNKDVTWINQDFAHLTYRYHMCYYQVHWHVEDTFTIGIMLDMSDEDVAKNLLHYPMCISVSAYDKDLTLQYGNDHFFHLFAYDKESFAKELSNKRAYLVHSEDRELVQHALAAAIAVDKGYVEIHVRGVKRDGKTIWITIHYFIMAYKETYVLLAFTNDHEYEHIGLEKQEQMQRKYQMVLNRMCCSFWEYDIPTRTIYPDSDSMQYFNNYKEIKNAPEAILHMDVILDADKDAFTKMFHDLEMLHQEVSAKIHLKKKNGQTCLLQITHIMLDPHRAMGFAQDISAIEEANNRYIQEGRLRSALVHDALASYEINISEDRIVEGMIDGCTAMLANVGLSINCSYNEFVHRWAASNVHEEDRDAFLERVSIAELKHAFAMGESEIVCEYRSHRKTEQHAHMEWVETVIHMFQNVEGCLSAFVYVKSIHERKMEEERLRKLSEIDPLTSINNRYALITRVETYIRQHPGTLAAMFVIDVDDFKHVNDTFGHTYGDKVLQDLAYKINKVFTKKDIIGRYGGDEFVAFLTDLPSEDYAIHKAEILANEIKMICEANNHHLELSNSIGIAFYPRHARNFSTLFEMADNALYLAKSSGKSQFCISKEEGRTLGSSTLINKEWLMDEMDEIVYVSDIDTYELLYLNAAGRKRSKVAVGEYEHKKCYEVIQGRDAPCPFCTNGRLSHDKFYVWEHENKLLNMNFFIKDKLIYWNHKSVRMEVAMDMSLPGNLFSIGSRYQMEKMLATCVQSLSEMDTFPHAVEKTLKIIAEFYQADRTYIMEINHEHHTVSNTYEWCKEGVESRIDFVQEMPLSKLPLIWDSFVKKEHLFISDVKELANISKQDFYSLRDRKVTSFFVIPYEDEGTFSGYLGVDNPQVNQDSISMLDSILYSIVNEMKKRKLYDEMVYHIYHDKLSGLLNRNSYSQYIDESRKEQAASYGVVFADINGLKKVNHDYGHIYGDKMIETVARLMKSYFPDANVFRLSGDEFCIVAKNHDYDAFMKAKDEMEDQFEIATIHGVSIGSTWSSQDVEVSDLIHHAEELMIINKHVYYEHSETSTKRYSHTRLEALQEVLREHYFHMYLQPKYDAKEETIIACEALARLIHPDFGFIAPNRFIPVLEKEQLIRYLDFYMLEEACKTLESWRKRGMRILPISINFSRTTLLEKDLLEVLQNMRMNFPEVISYIVIEITESVGNMERHVIGAIGQKIKDMGFTLSLDDFGADYANMAILSTLEFDELKLDRSMIENLVHNKPNQIVVNGVLDMCRRLHVKIVAEGVETIEQLQLLQEMGCDTIQGFYFSPPVPLDDFEKMLLE